MATYSATVCPQMKSILLANYLAAFSSLLCPDFFVLIPDPVSGRADGVFYYFTQIFCEQFSTNHSDFIAFILLFIYYNLQ